MSQAPLVPIYRLHPISAPPARCPVAQVLNTLRAHQVIGVDTRDLEEISVTRLAPTLEENKRSSTARSPALGRRNEEACDDAAGLTHLTFDRDPAISDSIPPTPGAVQPTAVRYEPARRQPFDVVRNRRKGTAWRQQAALHRVGRRSGDGGKPPCWPALSGAGDVKSSDVVVEERRRRLEVNADIAARDKAVGG